MYSRYDPTVHDTFLPVGREETAKTIEFPGTSLSDAATAAGSDAMGVTASGSVTGAGSDRIHGAESGGMQDAVTAGAMQGAAMLQQGTAASAAATAPRGGLLDGLRGLFGGSSSRGLLGNLDLGDIILLLIVALLFLEGGSESDLIILLGVALFIGF